MCGVNLVVVACPMGCLSSTMKMLLVVGTAVVVLETWLVMLAELRFCPHSLLYLPTLIPSLSEEGSFSHSDTYLSGAHDRIHNRKTEIASQGVRWEVGVLGLPIAEMLHRRLLQRSVERNTGMHYAVLARVQLPV